MIAHLKTFFNDINLNKEDRIYLIALLLLGTFLFFHLIHFNQMRGAFNSDIYIYLMNALTYANINYYNVSEPLWMFSSPVICFLTSLLFRMGFVDVTAIFIVTGLFCIIGMFGMYCLLKVRFSPLLSFVGTILFHSLSITLCWFANGMLDLPAVALLIWNMVLIVAAVDKNPKYYLLFSISFVISFFIRFTNAYILIIVFLYFLKNHDIIGAIDNLISDRELFKQNILSFIKSDEFKWICISIGIGVFLSLIVVAVIMAYGSDLIFLNIGGDSLRGFKASTTNKNYIPDKWFYFRNFLSMLSCSKITLNDQFGKASYFAYLICSILVMGILLKIVSYIKNVNCLKSLHNKAESYKTKHFKGILIISIFALAIASRFAFKIGYPHTILCVFIIFCILLSLHKKYSMENKFFAFSLMCFALFAVYMIVFSYIDLKCIRYVLAAFVGFVYFVTLSLEYILEFIENDFDTKKLIKLNEGNTIFKPTRGISKIILLVLIVICLFSICNYTNTMEIDQNGNDVISVCDFLKEYDSDYHDKAIGSYMNRYFEWYLNDKVIINHHDTKTSKYDYIIDNDKLDYTNYHEIYHSGSIYLYEKNK